jgi:hypothetical protein
MVSRWLLKGETYDLLEHHQDVSQLIIDAMRDPLCPRGAQARVPEEITGTVPGT